MRIAVRAFARVEEDARGAFDLIAGDEKPGGAAGGVDREPLAIAGVAVRAEDRQFARGVLKENFINF